MGTLEVAMLVKNHIIRILLRNLKENEWRLLRNDHSLGYYCSHNLHSCQNNWADPTDYFSALRRTKNSVMFLIITKPKKVKETLLDIIFFPQHLSTTPLIIFRWKIWQNSSKVYLSMFLLVNRQLGIKDFLKNNFQKKRRKHWQSGMSNKVTKFVPFITT